MQSYHQTLCDCSECILESKLISVRNKERHLEFIRWMVENKKIGEQENDTIARSLHDEEVTFFAANSQRNR